MPDRALECNHDLSIDELGSILQQSKNVWCQRMGVSGASV